MVKVVAMGLGGYRFLSHGNSLLQIKGKTTYNRQTSPTLP